MTDKPANELIHGELNCETAAKDNTVMWRCFHCSEAFRFDQQKEAAEHFGVHSGQTAVCLERLKGEKVLIAQLRKVQDELDEFRKLDGPYMNIMEQMEIEFKDEFERKEKELRDKYHEGYDRLNEEYKHLRTFKDMVNLVLTRNHVPQNVSDGNRLEWVFENYQKIEPQPEPEPEEKQPIVFFAALASFALVGIGYLFGLTAGVFNVLLPAVAGVSIVSALLWDVCNFEEDDDNGDGECNPAHRLKTAINDALIDPNEPPF